MMMMVESAEWELRFSSLLLLLNASRLEWPSHEEDEQTPPSFWWWWWWWEERKK